jgi:hypothetical protein
MRSRYGRERTMQEFEASPDVVHPHVPARAAAAPAESPVSPAPTRVSEPESPAAPASGSAKAGAGRAG